MKDFLIDYCTQITIIAFASFASYVISISTKWWKVPSISQSDKMLNKPWEWLFEAVMFICGIAIFTNGLRLENWMLEASGIMIFCVGIFTDHTSFMHIFCASGGFLTGIIAFDWITAVVIGAAVFIAFRNSEDFDHQITTFNIEVVLAVLLFIRLSLTL